MASESGTPSIPDEAIERAAASLVNHYDQLPEDIKEHWRRRARQAVPAAAPLIRAAAFDEAADYIHGMVQAYGYGPDDDPPGHSIPGALVAAAVELRERASALRGEGDRDG